MPCCDMKGLYLIVCCSVILLLPNIGGLEGEYNNNNYVCCSVILLLPNIGGLEGEYNNNNYVLYCYDIV